MPRMIDQILGWAISVSRAQRPDMTSRQLYMPQAMQGLQDHPDLAKPADPMPWPVKLATKAMAERISEGAASLRRYIEPPTPWASRGPVLHPDNRQQPDSAGQGSGL